MFMTLAEEYTTLGTLPAIFDMQEFMTLEVMTSGERSVTYVARKGRLMNTLVLSEICLTGEDLSTYFTGKGLFFFMQRFVFKQL